jgi:hypothetical protein
MNTPAEKANRKSDFELLFKDSPQYFAVLNARMIQEGALVRFVCFDNQDRYDKDVMFPLANIFRIQSIPHL